VAIFGWNYYYWKLPRFRNYRDTNDYAQPSLTLSAHSSTLLPIVISFVEPESLLWLTEQYLALATGLRVAFHFRQPPELD